MSILAISAILAAPAAWAVDGYSTRCGWCVAAGFWENVIRGNEKAAEFVDEGLQPMAVNLAAEFRGKIQDYCGPKFHEGDVETQFSYDPEPNAGNQGHKVTLHGEAWLTCKRKKKSFLKERLVVTTINRNGEWAVTDLRRLGGQAAGK